MKFIILIGTLLAGFGQTGFSQGLVLNAGDTYTYQFTNFVFQGTGAIGPTANVGLTISSLSPADTFEFSAYENNVMQTALVRTNFDANSGLPVFVLGSAWQDLQGVFTVTMLSGSMTLLDFYGSVITTGGDFYSEKPLSVPELSTGIFLAAGLAGLFLSRSSFRFAPNRNKARASL